MADGTKKAFFGGNIVALPQAQGAFGRLTTAMNGASVLNADFLSQSNTPIDPAAYLPAFIREIERRDNFKDKAPPPQAALWGIAVVADSVFSDSDKDQQQETYDQMLQRLEMIQRMEADFFINSIAPPVCYAIMLGGDELEHDPERQKTLQDITSLPVIKTFADLAKLRENPDRFHGNKVSYEAKLIFLLKALEKLEHIEELLLEGVLKPDSADYALYYNTFIAPFMNLEEYRTDIEDAVLRQIKRIEFILENADTELMWYLQVTSLPDFEDREPGELMYSCGIPDTEETEKAFDLLLQYCAYDTDKDGALAFADACENTLTPLKAYLSLFPDAPEEHILFMLCERFLDEPHFNGGEMGLIEQSLWDRFTVWDDTYNSPNDDFPALPEDVRHMLGNFFALKNLLRVKALLLQLAPKDDIPLIDEDIGEAEDFLKRPLSPVPIDGEIAIEFTENLHVLQKALNYLLAATVTPDQTPSPDDFDRPPPSAA